MKRLLNKNICKHIFAKFEVVILYTAFGVEISPKDTLFYKCLPKQKIFLPQEKNSDPIFLANKYKSDLVGLSVCIILPGKIFDACGTRHGRGGGWYDRFLSVVPNNWIRIGLTSKDGFSTEALSQEDWDESVDWVFVKNENGFIAYKTNARNLI